MLLATRTPDGFDTAAVAECIDAALACSQACDACADACLYEYDIRRSCVAACMTCADVCVTTARALSRTSEWDIGTVTALVEACAHATAACAQHCEEHADVAKHCAVCAESCRRVERACQQLLIALAASRMTV